MSKSKVPAAADLWEKLEAIGPQAVQQNEEINFDTTTLFVGDSGCGKSSLIQSFLKPTASKEPKPTFALEYNFARKKTGGQAAGKNVAHIWEMGGDIYEPRLLEVAITARNLSTTTVVVCCDLSKPQNTFSSLKKWIALVRDIIKRRLAELKSLNPTEVQAMKEKALQQYEENANDKSRAKPCEVPIIIIGTKFDVFKTRSVSERRAVMQVIRCVAHLHGATVFTASSVEAGLRDSLRNTINAICFRSMPRGLLEVSVDKPFSVSAGKDDFQQIILSSLSESSSSSHAPKSRLIYSESDVSAFFDSKGVSPECWAKFTEHLAALFGQADPLPEAAGDDDRERRDDNEFPESEIDEMRVQRDIALQRYIQEAERKDAMFAKLNAV